MEHCRRKGCIVLVMAAALSVTVPARARDTSAADGAGSGVYTWRDRGGTLHFSDSPPAGVSDYRRLPAAALRPTIIRSVPVTHDPQRRAPADPGAARRGVDLERLSEPCRWLVGRVRHLKDLVALHHREGTGPSIWQPELRQRRRELHKEGCPVHE